MTESNIADKVKRKFIFSDASMSVKENTTLLENEYFKEENIKCGKYIFFRIITLVIQY